MNSTTAPSEHEDEEEDDDGDTLSSTSTQGRGHRLIGPKGDFTTAPEISNFWVNAYVFGFRAAFANLMCLRSRLP